MFSRIAYRAGPISRGTWQQRLRLAGAYFVDGIVTLVGVPWGFEGCASAKVMEHVIRDGIRLRALAREKK